MEKGTNLFDDGEYSKAKQVFDGMVGYYPENSGAWIYLAMCQYKTNLVKEGDLSMKEFAKARAAQGDIDTLPEDQKKLLRNALIAYSEFLAKKSMRDSAKSTLEIGSEHFMKDPDFKAAWENAN
jgi:hypothetical protein